MKIYKYTIPAETYPEVEMPVGAKILSCQSQGDDICLWAEVDPAKWTSVRRFRVYATGVTLDKDPYHQKYLATVQLGALVFHVYETN